MHLCYISGMKVDRKAAVKKLKKLVYSSKKELPEFRKEMEEEFDTVFLPNRVECQEKALGGISCDVLFPELYASRKVILYVHGGSFVGGSSKAWRNFCASLANAAACRVVVPDFRLAPTHPFPASIDDLVAVFRVLYSEEEVAAQLEKTALNGGTQQHAQIIIAADGSGASLAMALMFKINKKYRSAVTNLLLFSPWLDITSEHPLIAKKRAADEVLSGDAMHRAADMYTYASNLSNPLVSPLKAPVEDFEGFPPVYVQVGEKEILLEQAKELDVLLDRAGIDCTVDVWENMMYMFQMADEFLPESHLAVERAASYISLRQEESDEDRRMREAVLKKNNIKNF